MLRMTWEFRSFSAKEGRPAREKQGTSGVLRIPAIPPLPRRESFLAISSATNWDAVRHDLVEYWEKVEEILPRYYGGHVAPDPLKGEPGTAVSPDLGWNRLVFLLDPVYGKLTTNLWVDDQPPKHCDRVWVMMKFPMIEEMPTRSARQLRKLSADMEAALADAAAPPAAVQAITRLQRWRDLSFWVMNEENPETLRPLLLGRRG